MLLQQLLERNKKHLTQVCLNQNYKKQSFYYFLKPNRKHSKPRILRQTLNSNSSNLLTNFSKINHIKGKEITRQTKIQSQFDINGQKYIFQNQKISRKNSNTQDDFLILSKISQLKHKNSYLLKNYDQGHKTTNSFYKANTKNDDNDRKVFTAINSKRSNSKSSQKLQSSILNLPDSFMIKTSLSLFIRPHQAFIKYDQNTKLSRQESIHSRRKMQISNQNSRNRRSKSQQSFIKQERLVQNSQNQNNPNFISVIKQIPVKKFNQLQIDVQKVNLVEKSNNKKQYINIFYEYRKAKAKIQKEQFYSPWKKGDPRRREIDLTELYQIHH